MLKCYYEMFLFLLQKIGNFQPGPSQSALLVPAFVLPLIISTDRWNICNMSLSMVNRLHKSLLNVISLFLWALMNYWAPSLPTVKEPTSVMLPLSVDNLQGCPGLTHLGVHHRHFSFLKRGKISFPTALFSGMLQGWELWLTTCHTPRDPGTSALSGSSCSLI